MSRMIAGCGYLGSRVARLWRQAGQDVVVVTRSSQRAVSLREQGLRPIIADIAAGGITQQLHDVTTLLFSVGYDRTSSYDHQRLHPEGLFGLLGQLPNLESLVYISTTGVYGGCDGQWVQENSPTHPERASSAASLKAEKVAASWASLEPNRVASSLRMGGLYGPRRIPHIAKLQAGEPLTVSPDGFLNLVQIDDAARIVSKIPEADDLPPVLNVTDGNPVERRDFYAEIAAQTGSAAPRYVAPNAGPRSSGTRGFTNRRVSNRLLASCLELDWQHSDYRAGIAHALASDLGGPSDDSE
jgi:nucleoside-diphosphate-sugar epimerase